MDMLNTRFVYRSYSRFPVHCSMMYLGQAVSGQGIVRELSLMGCQALGNAPVTVGRTLSLRVALPNSHEPLVITQASVKWTKGLECGIAFDHLEEREKVRLQQVLDESLARRRYTAAPHTDKPNVPLIAGP